MHRSQLAKIRGIHSNALSSLALLLLLGKCPQSRPLPHQQEPVEKVSPPVFGSFRASCVGVRDCCERGANINADCLDGVWVRGVGVGR